MVRVRGRRLKFDAIGSWSEIKIEIEIVRKYAEAYSTVLAKQRLRYSYIDGFSGPGEHRRKHTGEQIMGTPLEVLSVQPRFHDYYFVDSHAEKIAYLRKQIGERNDVHTYIGDTNTILPRDMFPRVAYADYRRGLCLLDPYGLDLDWATIEAAGGARSIEIFLNFPTADMQRNVFWRNHQEVDPRDIARMDRFWGDDSWRNVVYVVGQDLFGPVEIKSEMIVIVEAFRERLRAVAGFKHVPSPIAMRNDQGAIVYYLFFASQNETGARIANDILKRHRS
jgi:three-Cys-motif partner protein